MGGATHRPASGSIGLARLQPTVVPPHAVRDHAELGSTELTLDVYSRNVRAIHFYRREEFRIQSEDLDGSTSEREYAMRRVRRSGFPAMTLRIRLATI